MQHPHTHSNKPSGVVSDDLAALMRFATYASVAMASLLLTAKLIAWWKTDSLSMLSSFTDSVFDVVMSVVNMLAVRYSLKPADDDHRFGHSSIEDIAGLAQCAFIVAAMAMIVLQSVERLANPHSILSNPELGVGVSVVGMVLTTGLVMFQTYVTKRARSVVIAADRLHYLGDILFNGGVLVAFVLSSWCGLVWADATIAILIALIVLWSNRTIGIRAFNNLMDREMAEEEKASILALVNAIPEIRGHHNLKTRYSGMKAFVQLHIDIDAHLNFQEAHTITDRLEKAIVGLFPGADVIVHPDPV